MSAGGRGLTEDQAHELSGKIKAEVKESLGEEDFMCVTVVVAKGHPGVLMLAGNTAPDGAFELLRFAVKCAEGGEGKGYKVDLESFRRVQ